jgi:hypothetical protein
MKLRVLFMVSILVSLLAVSCKKSDVNFEKMPDNGSTKINCPTSPTGK